MSLFDNEHKVIRGYTERQLEMAISTFKAKKAKDGESWYVSGRDHKPARLLNYKPHIAYLEKV